jgi:hypothetical protein
MLWVDVATAPELVSRSLEKTVSTISANEKLRNEA